MAVSAMHFSFATAWARCPCYGMSSSSIEFDERWRVRGKRLVLAGHGGPCRLRHRFEREERRTPHRQFDVEHHGRAGFGSDDPLLDPLKVVVCLPLVPVL